MGAGQIFSLPRTDDFSRRRTTKLLTAKVVSTMAFQNKIKICPAPVYKVYRVYEVISFAEGKTLFINSINFIN